MKYSQARAHPLSALSQVIFPQTDRRRLNDDLPPMVEVARRDIQTTFTKDAYWIKFLRLDALRRSVKSLALGGMVNFSARVPIRYEDSAVRGCSLRIGYTRASSRSAAHPDRWISALI